MTGLMQRLSAKPAVQSSLPGPLLALRGAGAVTVIGNSAVQTASSWVGQVRRLMKRRVGDLPNPVTVAECDTVTGGLHGAERLLAMLPSAVSEALEALGRQLPSTATAPPTTPGTTGAKIAGIEALELLVLPRWLSSEESERIGAVFGQMLAADARWSSFERRRVVLAAGSCGAWDALEVAYRQLDADDALQHVLIAAVDSLCEPGVLASEAEADKLLRAGNSEGYVAGEAAACVVLHRVADVTALASGDFALHRPALNKAPPPAAADAPLTSEPLTRSLELALGQAGMQGQHISHLCSDADGSAWRARLESVALTRTVFTTAGPLPQWHLPQLLGQIGTPSGSLAWLLPAQLERHRVQRVNSLLVWSVEPDGQAAAVVLERSPT